MPKLQIDGQYVAQITTVKAEEILAAVKLAGVGKEPKPQPSGQLEAPLYQATEMPPKPKKVDLVLEFNTPG